MIIKEWQIENYFSEHSQAMPARPSVNIGWRQYRALGTERKVMGIVMLKHAAKERNRVFDPNFVCWKGWTISEA